MSNYRLLNRVSARAWLVGVSLFIGSSAVAQCIVPIAEKIAPKVADRQDQQVPDRVHLGGWLGMRIDANSANRMAKVDTDRLLEGFRHRPGRQAWDGEHVGKWLHAATLAWANASDATLRDALRAKLRETVRELCKCQLDDGYLGTYVDTDRWTEWDVWAHKYNLLGLITYVRLTGDTEPLATCYKMGDLLCATFGDENGKRDILTAGHHVGMAPTSVLEPMVLLYRLTGEPRYLDFCRYLVRSWERPGGPQIVSRLRAGQGVDTVGNGKAYEMLSCLNGALELYRTTGDAELIDACRRAWQDIVDHRLYPTGAASYCEMFSKDNDFPNSNNVGETCVTVTWLQFNAQLLRVTGEARFAEQIERVALNQLLGAQQPDGAAWGYYVQMEGKKPYTSTLDGQCCLSSGPRGVALLPTLAVTTDADGAVVNLLEAATANLTLRDGSPLSLTIETGYPSDGRVRVIVRSAPKREVSIKLRVPAWSSRSQITPEGATVGDDGYRVLRRVWNAGDAIELNLTLEPRIVLGTHNNLGKAALWYGPLVLAADESLLGDPAATLNGMMLPGSDLRAIDMTPEPATAASKTWPGALVFRIRAAQRGSDRSLAARLVTFADAGSSGSRYRVWLPIAGLPNANVLLDGEESRSRPGNEHGSIIDGDVLSLVNTYESKPAAEDWFAVTLRSPATVRRVTFVHGRNYHDGGWFDTSNGKPRVQVRRASDAEWETVGELSDYPATTARSGEHDRLTWSNRQFTLLLDKPIAAVAVRVIGVPSCGDNAKQAFASCAELQAFAD